MASPSLFCAERYLNRRAKKEKKMTAEDISMKKIATVLPSRIMIILLLILTHPDPQSPTHLFVLQVICVSAKVIPMMMIARFV